jgi:5-oxoprolinase (ATP-hydrolysing)
MSRRSRSELDIARTGARLMFMMSSGGLTAAELFQGKDAILSGPAGGVVGLAETGGSAGFDKVIGFDMGGTSTDVAIMTASMSAPSRPRSPACACARR